MIVKILILSAVCFLVLLFFYPLRFLLDISYAEGQGRGKVKICPIFTLRCFAFSLFDTEAEKKPKRQKKKKAKAEKPPKKEKKKVEREMVPLHEMLLSCIELMGRMKKGVKRLRIRLNLAYGFPDPALTGELTGAFYAALPPFFGDMKHCKWKIGLYPQWCPPSAMVGLKGDLCFNFFEILIAFIGMIPELMKILPKKKKHMEVHDESTSH